MVHVCIMVEVNNISSLATTYLTAIMALCSMKRMLDVVSYHLWWRLMDMLGQSSPLLILLKGETMVVGKTSFACKRILINLGSHRISTLVLLRLL